jgi:hypothetical protein
VPTLQTLASPDDLPPRTALVDITAPKFELHHEGDAFRVGHPGFWIQADDMAGIPDAILTIATAAYLRAGATS